MPVCLPIPAADEEYIHQWFKSARAKSMATHLPSRLYHPPSRATILKARRRLLMEREMKRTLVDVLCYVVFLVTLCLVVYGNQEPQAYYSTRSAKSMFLNADYQGDRTLDDVRNLNKHAHLSGGKSYIFIVVDISCIVKI